MRNDCRARAGDFKSEGWFWARCSRIVLVLTGLLVLVMPLTEYLWHFDNFFRGGDDLELGLFSVAMAVCLILVMLQHGNRGFSSILLVREWVPLVLPECADRLTAGRIFRCLLDIENHDVPMSALSRYKFPILI